MALDLGILARAADELEYAAMGNAESLYWKLGEELYRIVKSEARVNFATLKQKAFELHKCDVKSQTKYDREPWQQCTHAAITALVQCTYVAEALNSSSSLKDLLDALDKLHVILGNAIELHNKHLNNEVEEVLAEPPSAETLESMDEFAAKTLHGIEPSASDSE